MTIGPTRLLLAAIAATASIAGCGGQSDSDRIKDLVRQYVDAFAAKDGARVCSLLTPEAQRRVQASAGLLRGKDCAATITAVAKLTSGPAAPYIRKFHAGKIVVDGNEAGVQIEPTTKGAKPTRLVKVDGKWLFDGSVATVN